MNAEAAQKIKKADATRDKILTTAIALFEKKGFERTTMREIAKSAGTALGGAYYYFRTKDEIVLAFYRQTLVEHVAKCKDYFVQTHDTKKRIEFTIQSKFDQWEPYRDFLAVLARAGIDKRSPISPFSEETRAIRDESIQLFAIAIQGDKKIPAYLVNHLPRLLWLYQMGLILYWTNDTSPGQTKTKHLFERSLGLILRLIKLAGLPLMGAAVKPGLQLLDDIWNDK